MGRQTGATSNTAQRLITDAGVLIANYEEDDERKLGATQGGVTFEVEQTIREVEIDGFRGPMKGARRITTEHARLTASLLEMTTDNLKMVLAGSPSDTEVTAEDAGSPTHTEVRRTTDIPADSEYLTNLALVARVQGSDQPIVIILYDVLADGGISIETADEGEGAPEIQFTAHMDPSEPDKSPYVVRYPLDVDDADTT